MKNEQNSIEDLSDRDLQKSAPKPLRPLVEDRVHIHEDNAFLGSLSLRMKNADWNKYERGSEEFFDVDRDLEKLAKSSPATAVELWKENAPKGTKLPFYLTAELEQQAQEPARDAPKPTGQKMDLGDEYELPSSIKKRYLETEGRFHFRDDQNRLAFEDRGRRVVTEHNDPAIAASMVELAEAKGWSKIKVAGHEDFKREVWLQASLKNIEVTGYKPKDVDLAKLEEMKPAKSKNVIEQVESRDIGIRHPRDNGDSKTLADEKKVDAKPQAREQANPNVVMGKLVEHGPAPFDFDEKNEPSYFVKVETALGTKMHWGVDLERAMAEGGVKKGERIELERLGKEPVTVKEKQFDGSGKMIGYKDIQTERVKWRSDPEGARRETKEQEPVLKGDYKVAASVMAEVLKDKGYSTKTIDKAVIEATRRLSAMDKNGDPAPRVKVFDKSAPRAIERPKVISRSQQREAERTR